MTQHSRLIDLHSFSKATGLVGFMTQREKKFFFPLLDQEISGSGLTVSFFLPFPNEIGDAKSGSTKFLLTFEAGKVFGFCIHFVLSCSVNAGLIKTFPSLVYF